MKKTTLVLMLVFLCAATPQLAGCAGSPATTAAQPPTTNAGPSSVQQASAQPTTTSDTADAASSMAAATTTTTLVYSDGVRLVGAGMPAGLYKGTTDSAAGYWKISTDPDGQNILASDLPNGPFYVQVSEGQYLLLSHAKVAQADPTPVETPPLTQVSDGVYLVGVDIAAGRYKGTHDRASGYWMISNDPAGLDIVGVDHPNGQFYVQVQGRQYLKLSGVTISLLAPGQADYLQ